MSSSPKKPKFSDGKEYLFTTICHSKKSYTPNEINIEIGKDYDVYKAKYFYNRI